MTAFLAGAGAGLAWFGGAVLVVSDARRGLAVGLVLSAAGLALAAGFAGAPLAAAVVAMGAVAAAVAGLRGDARRGWGVLQVEPTPRIVLAVVVGGAALWFGAGLLDDPGQAAARGAAAIAIALGGGRLLGEREPRSVLSAAALIALGAGLLASLAAQSVAGATVGALAAVALNLAPATGAREDG